MIKRALKYIIHALILYMAAKFVPSRDLSLREVTIIAAIGSVTFAILDMYYPAVSDKARKRMLMTLGMKTITA